MNATAWRLMLGAATLAIGLGILFAETQGFRVLTSTRDPAVRTNDHPVFEAPLRTSDARSVSMLPAPGTLRVVEITYEGCRTVCAVQGDALAAAFVALRAEREAERLHFISLSVDPRDCPAGIERRVRRLSAGSKGWDGVCVEDEAGLSVLARRVGLIAIRDVHGDYRHTVGVFLVGRDDHVVAYAPSTNSRTLVLAIQDALHSAGPDGHG